MHPAGEERSISHVLLTRFNLPTPGPEELVRAKEGWLRTRWGLFCTYTVPSVLNQSTDDFTWIIYFDPESPQWLLDGIAEHSAHGIYHPVYRTSVDKAALVGDIQQLAPRATTLLTTNLDNDDGLARDFLERLQGMQDETPRVAVYLTRGLILSGTKIYARTDRDNAFCSVREGWDQPMTCWTDWHILLGRHMPVREVRGDPAWLQVVHGTNVSNRVHGTLVGKRRYRELFPGLLDQTTEPTQAEILLDRIVHAPLRSTRDLARMYAKKLMMKAAGKDGLDKIKSRLASLKKAVGR